MSRADAIRRWIVDRLVEPARLRGEEILEIRAGDVHSRLGLRNRLPLVCSVVRGHKLLDAAGLEPLHPPPPDGADAVFRYRLRPSSATGTGREPETKPDAGTSANVSAQRAGMTPGQSRERAAARRPPPDPAGALVLVSCVASKRPHRAKAKDLYVSPLFRGMRAVAERGAAWRILSAEHGLLDPEREIEPYERTLRHMGRAERRAWADRVLAELLPLARGFDRVIVLAGNDYRGHLVPALERAGLRVEVPLEGLGLGEQLSQLQQWVAETEG